MLISLQGLLNSKGTSLDKAPSAQDRVDTPWGGEGNSGEACSETDSLTPQIPPHFSQIPAVFLSLWLILHLSMENAPPHHTDPAQIPVPSWAVYGRPGNFHVLRVLQSCLLCGRT